MTRDQARARVTQILAARPITAATVDQVMDVLDAYLAHPGHDVVNHTNPPQTFEHADPEPPAPRSAPRRQTATTAASTKATHSRGRTAPRKETP